MPSQTNTLFTVNWLSLVESIATAIFTAILVALGAVVMAPNFDLFAVNWIVVGHTMLNVAVVTACGVLLRNFVTDQNGKMFGRFGKIF